MFCHKCGTQIPEGSEFCHMCGTKVVFEEAEDSAVSDDSSGGEEIRSASDIVQEINSDASESRTQTKSAGGFSGASIVGKILIVIGLCFGLFILVVLLKALFSSSPLLIVGLLAVIYFVCRPFMEKDSYDKKDHSLRLPDGMDAQGLYDVLNRNFNYPYFKGVRCDVKGNCVIEGKYGSYPVHFDKNGQASLRYTEADKNANFPNIYILREATAIHSYLNKFFDPDLAVDTAADLESLQSAEKQSTALKIAKVLVSVVIVVGIAVLIMDEYSPGTIQSITKPGAEVRGAYLTQYSDTVTIEEAFENFFGNCKWSTFESEGYSYVAFTGTCQYGGEQADVRILFKVTGEYFRPDQLDINGVEQSDIILAVMLSSVYENQ